MALAVLCIVSRASSSTVPVEVSTGDGLAVRLAPTVQVRLGGRALPATDKPGGLLIRDAARQPRPNLLANPGFEEGAASWIPEGKCAVDASVAHEGQASLRLEASPREQERKSRLVSLPVPAKSETDYVVSLWARGKELVHYDRAGHALFDWSACVLQTDEAGRETAPAFQVSFPTVPTSEFDWTLVRSAFRTRPQTSKARIACTVTEGKGALWVDDVGLSEVGSGPEVTVSGKFERSAATLVQRAELKGMGLAVRAEYRPGKGKIEVAAKVADTTGKERALQVGFRLPVNLCGWQWGQHLRAEQTIEPTKSYHNWFELGPGRVCGVYPFSAVTGKEAGIGLGIPMDVPRVFRVSDEPTGLEIWFDLGLSPETERLPSRASFVFVLYTYPAKWGFRAATRKYHDLYPRLLERRAKWCGNWGLNPHLVRNPEDFAMRFGGAPLSWANQHGFSSLIYNEPWGWWMPWGTVKTPGEKRPPPSYEEALECLRQATRASPETDAGFMLPYMPRRDIAQAAMNAAPHDEQGRNQTSGLGWTTFGSNTWMQHYPINPDPDIRPLPNRDSLTRRWVLQPYFRHARMLGLDAGGAYIDSVSAGLIGLSSLENYRRSHWRVTKQPLVFNPATRAVCQLYLFSAYDFLSKLSADLHEQGKLMFCNMGHGYGLTYLGHLFDLIGREGDCEFLGVPYLGGFNQSDEMLNYLHVLSGPKPISFYDYDYWRKGFGDPNRERRVRKCLFYGVFPGLPWVNEAEAAEGSESMRTLARKYFPAMERMAEAGWEPITGAVASDSAVMVERYGDGSRHKLHFTLRNETPRELSFSLAVNLAEVGLAPVSNQAAEDLLAGRLLHVRRQGNAALMESALAPDETLAVALGAPADLARPHLKTAGERLALLRDIGAFNPEPAPKRSIDLRSGWYVDKVNGKGTYGVEEDPTVLDCRGRATIRICNEAREDCGIYCSGPCELKVKAGEEYELLLHCKVCPTQPRGGGEQGLSVVVGFSEYFGRLLENAWQEVQLPATPPYQWGWRRVRITAPANAYRIFFRFVLKGNDATVWLGDQRLVRSNEADVALAELEQVKPPDNWLGTQMSPRLRALGQEIAQAAVSPTLTKARGLHQRLSLLKDELQERYPAASDQSNQEAWQRLTDALAQTATAVELLRGTS